MSDKEKLIRLLREFGVGYEEDKYKKDGEDKIAVNCVQGMDKVGGYGGFVTTFEFNADGTFVSVGAWE